MISELLNKIKGLRVAVIGDMMIDETLSGVSTRMSPEAPVPVIDIQGRTITPGGAANVAMNVAALGAQVTLFTQPGDDRDAGILVNRMTMAGVRVVFEPTFDRSIRKCRIVSNGKQVCRIDTGSKLSKPLHISPGTLRSFDLVILSDYGYGAISQEMVDAITPSRKFTLVADPKPRSGIIYKGADIITPNLGEVCAILDCFLEPITATEILRYRWGVDYCVTTQGEGDTLVGSANGVTSIGTYEVAAVDPCGAGDTFIAALACAYAADTNILMATSFANKCAAVVVGKRGTAVVCPHELRSEGGDTT